MVGIPQIPHDTPVTSLSNQIGGGAFDFEFVPAMMSMEELVDTIGQLQDDFFADTPMFELVMKMFPDLCCTALVDPRINFIIQTESLCGEYHVLPFEGGLLDQPLWVIEAFEEIGRIRSIFERRRMDELNRKAAIKVGNKST